MLTMERDRDEDSRLQLGSYFLLGWGAMGLRPALRWGRHRRCGYFPLGWLPGHPCLGSRSEPRQVHWCQQAG